MTEKKGVGWGVARDFALIIIQHSLALGQDMDNEKRPVRGRKKQKQKPTPKK